MHISMLQAHGLMDFVGVWLSLSPSSAQMWVEVTTSRGGLSGIYYPDPYCPGL